MKRRSRRPTDTAELICAERKRVCFSWTLCFAAFAALAAPSDAHRKDGPPSTGLRAISYAKAPPDFTFATGAGTARLTQYLGRPVVVNFFATWCGPCAAELDAFAAQRTAYGDRVALLAISDEAPGVARAFLAAHHIDAEVIEDTDRRIFEAYSIRAIPVTLVLARDGTVSHVSIGQLDWKELRDALEPLLDPRPQI